MERAHLEDLDTDGRIILNGSRIGLEGTDWIDLTQDKER
jgi:hypothetical protein